MAERNDFSIDREPTDSELSIDWKDYKQVSDLVERIRADDEGAKTVLYNTLRNGALFARLKVYLRGDEAEDYLHDIYAAVLKAIKEDKIKEPARLMGYVEGTLRYKIYNEIGNLDLRTKRAAQITPESAILSKNEVEKSLIKSAQWRILDKLLKTMKPEEEKILRGFYLSGKTKKELKDELSLSETQFRLNKSKAKKLLEKIGMDHLKSKKVKN